MARSRKGTTRVMVSYQLSEEYLSQKRETYNAMSYPAKNMKRNAMIAAPWTQLPIAQKTLKAR